MLKKNELKEIVTEWKTRVNELIDSDEAIHDSIEREEVRRDYDELFDTLDETIDNCYAEMANGEETLSNLIIAAVSYLSFASNPIETDLTLFYTAEEKISEGMVYGLDGDWFYEGRLTHPEHSHLQEYCLDIERGVAGDAASRKRLLARLKNSTMFDSFRCIFEGTSPRGNVGDMKALGKEIYEEWGAAEIIRTYDYHIYIPSYIGENNDTSDDN